MMVVRSFKDLVASLGAVALTFGALGVGGCSAGIDESSSGGDVGSEQQPLTTTLAINAGGPASAPFSADGSFAGGTTINHANVIDTAGVVSPAPAAVYQTARVGNFSYTLAGFAPGAARKLRLHFAETYFSKAGARVFNVTVNGAAALSAFDVFAAAGGKNKALVRELNVVTSGSGNIVVAFQSVTDKALVSGIEVGAVDVVSQGCGKAPTNESPTAFVAHDVNVGGLDPIYLAGGALSQTSGPYDFSHRVYTVRLPVNYDPSKAYPVTVGGGGCGGNSQSFAANPGPGFQVVASPNSETIQVGLAYVNGCFADGGPGIQNRTDTPELPYFRAVLADVQSRLCVDTKRVFVSGFSSGAFESQMLGCAAADAVRGISTLDGGLRAARPACKGPSAAYLITDQLDTVNPEGPLAPTSADYQRLGGPGLLPTRDDYLQRNGCIGSATAAWDPAYPACVKYTGCPAAYPVVWCSLPLGHGGSVLNGTDYNKGMWKFLSSLPKP